MHEPAPDEAPGQDSTAPGLPRRAWLGGALFCLFLLLWVGARLTAKAEVGVGDAAQDAAASKNGGPVAEKAHDALPTRLPLAPVFAPGTSEDYVRQVMDQASGLPLGLSPQGPSRFQLGGHWNPGSTATNDGTSSAQGEPLTLTYSFLPDGTQMPAQGQFDTTCFSSLHADLNAVYGNGNWQAEVAEVLAQWASLTGNEYVFEPADDGAPWPNSPGASGVRGDVRVGGCTIDGNGGVLAFNFFPNIGDMKLDSKDSFFNGSNLNTGFHNVFSHEHGHGLGLSHVCPVNLTKLMEPFVTSAFIGLQHDEIRGGQRHYGDANEVIGGPGNDSAASATDLGVPNVGVPIVEQNVSIDDDGDEDWFKLTPTLAGLEIDVTVTPIGFTYDDDSQSGGGLGGCPNPPANSTNSLSVHDLAFQVIDSDGSSVILNVDDAGLGTAEMQAGINLGSAGEKFIRVFGDASNDVQLYELSVNPTSVSGLIFSDGFESGDVSKWSAAVP